MGSRNSGRMEIEAMGTRGMVKEMQGELKNRAERNPSRNRPVVGSEIGSVLFSQSLKRWPFSLEKVCGADYALVKEQYSLFVFPSIRYLYLRVSILLKTSFSSCLLL